MNITFIGMPGVGKSTLGKRLAKRLGYAFLDTDILIQHRAGKPLQAILDTEGEVAFKQLEETTILSLKSLSNTIISPGGSAVYSEVAMKHLRSLSQIVYLYDTQERVLRRISNMATRGIVGLHNRSFAELYSERHSLYPTYAHLTFDLSKHPERENLFYLEKEIQCLLQKNPS